MVEIRNIIAEQKQEGATDYGQNIIGFAGKLLRIKAVTFGENDDKLEYANITLEDGTKLYTFSGVLIKQLKLCATYLSKGEVLEGTVTRPREKDYYTFQ